MFTGHPPLEKSSSLAARSHHWKSRLSISLLLLVLAFIGILITSFSKNIAFYYWLWIVPFFAVLCIWLSWLNGDQKKLDGVTIWHEIMHWLAFLVVVYFLYFFVHLGMMSHLMAGFCILLLMTLTTFLAGIYIDITFMFIGIMLAVLTLIGTFFIKYLFVFTIPIVIAVAILLIWFHQKKTVKDIS